MVGPSLVAAAMFAVLIALGLWQVRRLAWKQGILAAIDRAERAPAVPLPAHPAAFQKVAVAGTLRPDLSILYGADVRDTPQGPRMGGQLIQPLVRPDRSVVLVDRGWVAEQAGSSVATPAGLVDLDGYVRTPDHPHLFSPHDDPRARRFYTLDPARMGAALGLTVAPFTFVVLGPEGGGMPIPATALPRPPNDHLNYAITWFSLALVLLVVFGLRARRALLDTPR